MRLEAYTVRDIVLLPPGGLMGRRKILAPVESITADNVLDVLSKALAVHALNAGEITYLYNYYKGNQDIRAKVKLVRPEINNCVVVNRANEIVTFKTSYVLAEPVQYIAHNPDKPVTDAVKQLNEYMRLEDKESKDKEIVDWMHICGLGIRMVLTDEMAGVNGGAPYYIYTLDPREAFVIYSSRIGQKAIAGVVLQQDDNEKWFATVYTPTRVLTVRSDGSVSEQPNFLGGIPVFEYLNNEARMGAFEPVISILNSINVLESNAVDSVQDFVNGYDVFQNCEIDDSTYKGLGIGDTAVKIKTVTPGMEAKVYRVFSEISQPGVQTRIDDLTTAYLEICGMPNRNGGLSTSDTGAAVMYRDGFIAAHARAIDTTILFKRAEREFDRIVLHICSTKGRLSLDLADFEPKFPLGNLVNQQSLAQVFIELLNQPMVHPKTAYEVGSALFKDPENAYQMGQDWYDEQQQEQEEDLRVASQRGVSSVTEEVVDAGQYPEGDPNA